MNESNNEELSFEDRLALIHETISNTPENKLFDRIDELAAELK